MDQIVIKSKQYELPPEDMHRAVCVDLIDLGEVVTPWGNKHKGRIVFEIDKLMSDGRPYTASKQFNLVLGEKSNLERFISTWRGRAFTAAERSEFLLNTVVGLPGKILIEHVERDGKKYANIVSVIKAGDNPLKPSGKYVRRVKKVEEAPTVPAALAKSQEKF